MFFIIVLLVSSNMVVLRVDNKRRIVAAIGSSMWGLWHTEAERFEYKIQILDLQVLYTGEWCELG